jgi:ATP-binding cassette, subfamily B (MDR/TAP), member 1
MEAKLKAETATYPVQAFLFAKVVDVFTILNMDDLVRRGNFLALMFCLQAVCVATAFLVLGWSAAIAAAVSLSK